MSSVYKIEKFVMNHMFTFYWQNKFLIGQARGRQKEGERRLGRDQLHLGSRVIYREGELTATLTSGLRCFDKFLYQKLVKCKFLIYDCGVLTNLE